MKAALVGAAILAAVGCQSEPAIRTPAPKVSTGPGSPTGPGPVDQTTTTTVAPTTTTTEPPPTTTTVAEQLACPGYGHPLHHLSCDEAAAAVARRAPVDYDVPSPQARTTGRGSEPAGGDTLACIRSYEQGADGYATDTGNGYGGAYQFDQQTWSSVGGSGRPADASPAEQDKRAQMLLDSRGLAPWPTPNRMCR